MFLVATAIGTVLACGCAQQGGDRPATYATTGTVTLDGQPVAGAAVSFTPSQKGGTPAVGTTDASGRYSLKSFGTEEGAVPGEYLVAVTKYEYAESASASASSGSEMPADYMTPGENAGSGGKNALPAKYESPANSGLKATVTEGENVVDLKLESGGASAENQQ
jgi:hypothetical protein